MGLRSRIGAVISTVCIIGVQSCGMGSGNTPPYTHPHGSSDIYLPYYIKQADDSVPGEIKPFYTTAIIGVNPKKISTKGRVTTIHAIDSFSQQLTPRASLRAGQYNDSEFKVHHFQQTGMLYTLDGQFFMVDFTAVKPVPMRVSSETGADLICDWFVAYHYPEQHHTVYLYSKPTKPDTGGAYTCSAASAPRWFAIRIDDPENKAPRPLPENVTAVVSQLYNLQKDAELRGFLVEMGGKLQTITADFVMHDSSEYNAAPVVYSDGVTEVALNGAYAVRRQNRTPEKLYWLKINDAFYLYDPIANKLLADSTAQDLFKVGGNEYWSTQFSDNELLVTVSDKSFNGGETPTYVKVYRFPNRDGYAKNTHEPVINSTKPIGDLRYVPGGFIYMEGAWKSPAAKFKLVKWTSGVPTVREIYALPEDGNSTVNGLYLRGNRLFVETFDSANKRFALAHADWSADDVVWTSVADSEYGLQVVALVSGHVYDPVLDENDLKYLVVQDTHKITFANGKDGAQNELIVIDAVTGEKVRSLGSIRLGQSNEARSVARQNFNILARDDGLLEVGVYSEASLAVDKFSSISMYYFDASIENSLTEVSRSESNTIKCGFTSYFPRWSADGTTWNSRFNDKEQCE